MRHEGEVTFKEDVEVETVKCEASDLDVVWSARVSTQGETHDSKLMGTAEEGLINFLMKNRHGTPFEHNSFTFYVQAPIFVFREFMRHRIGISYNEESGRYKKLDPVFYVPPVDRPLQQVGKPGHYKFVEGTRDQQALVHDEIKVASFLAYQSYEQMLDAGIAREVARMVLPVNIFSSMYVTLNARSLMNFLSLRTEREETMFPSYPQREIEMVAEKMEVTLMFAMPQTYKSFNDNGRVAP